MQYFRLFPAVVAIALGSIPLQTKADDTPAQAAARAAMEQQMNQMDTEQSNSAAAPQQPAPAAPVPAPEAPPPAAPETPAPTPPPAATETPTVTPPPAVPETPTATAPQAAPAAPQPAPDIAPPPAAPEQPATVPSNNSNNTTTTVQYPVNPPVNSPGSTNIQPITVTQPGVPLPPPNAPEIPATVTPPPQSSQPETTLKPMTPAPQEEGPVAAPPLPISEDKQSQLNDLLARYRADQITPAQYQDERAKILAGP